MGTALEHYAAEIRQELRDVDEEACGAGAVDDAVVVTDADRQDQTRGEVLAVPHRLHGRARGAEDGNLGRVDDLREGGSADAPDRRDRERAALHLGKR